ncbi:penicillin acylase family protein [Janthinobacterium fluminis]|uniref:Penicillin acylase family protein n=1 Tax=Janthinobacterium fluminis TaxID=2987524 RepID=A0ABT5K1E2_9BURK|nr:penicillin acylase family protein [Janthinobacterium fluminis]MDC8758490.1 penicillin acylase family protein [Janthinobacterium fluminis]
MRKIIIVAWLAAGMLVQGCGSDAGTPPPVARGSEVLWDHDGVPHIYAAGADSVGYAFGRAQMQMHAELLIRMYAQARGRGAEYYGEEFKGGELFPVDMLEVDRLVRTMAFPRLAQEWTAAQSPRMRAYLDAFVAGLNEQAAAQDLSPEARSVLPLRVEDVMGHTLRTFFAYLTGGTATGAANCSMIYPSDEMTGLNLIGGSNGWALGPSKTANGKAMLLANPHLLWGGNHTWFEAQFSSPQYAIYGATLVGLPVIRIGFNDRHGWVHTVNTQDGCDLYELKRDGERYQLDGQWTAFEQSDESVLVKLPGGALEPRPLKLRRSVHGAVFEKNGKTYALRVVGVDQLQTPGVLEQWWDMAQAADFGAFQRVVQRQQNPFHNIIYADAGGNIWSVFGGMTPVRPLGDAAFWAEPVDGSNSGLIWRRAHAISEMPQVSNPASGWVQNSNSVPWFMSKPALDPAAYPSYVSPRVAPLMREQRGIELIEQTARFTLDDLVAAKHDTRALLADRVLPDLLAAAGASGNAEAVRAGRVLEQWDRRTESASRGALLFRNWVSAMGGSHALPYVSGGNYAEPYTSPRGLLDPVAAVTALAGLVTELDRIGVPLDTAYGDVYRFRRGSGATRVDFPANGSGDELGGFRSIDYLADKDGAQKAIFGDTFVALVEFGPTVRAKVINTYGNSSDPANAAFGSQLELASRKAMRDALLVRSAVEGALKRREVFEK